MRATPGISASHPDAKLPNPSSVKMATQKTLSGMHKVCYTREVERIIPLIRMKASSWKKYQNLHERHLLK